MVSHQRETSIVQRDWKTGSYGQMDSHEGRPCGYEKTIIGRGWGVVASCWSEVVVAQPHSGPFEFLLTVGASCATPTKRISYVGC
jgi:hypothetical protein